MSYGRIKDRAVKELCEKCEHVQISILTSVPNARMCTAYGRNKINKSSYGTVNKRIQSFMNIMKNETSRYPYPECGDTLQDDGTCRRYKKRTWLAQRKFKREMKKHGISI